MAIGLALTIPKIPILSAMGDDAVRQFINPNVPEVIVSKEVDCQYLAKVMPKLYLELVIMTVLEGEGDAVVGTPTFNYHVAETLERVYSEETEGMEGFGDDEETSGIYEGDEINE